MSEVQVLVAETVAPNARLSAPKVRLGEELPIFCERCGYSLNGLPQNRCEHCELLHFHCPECGHHQPINTLRPAAQRIIGRLRALGVAWIVFLKINFFGWLLFAWFGMGVEWGYTWDQTLSGLSGRIAAPLTTEMVICFGLLAVPFASTGRLLLLRWRNGILVGAVLGVLVCGAILLGFHMLTIGHPSYALDVLLTEDRVLLLGLTFGMIVASAALAWPIWVGLVKVFLPARSAEALLDWQRSMSDGSALARV